MRCLDLDPRCPDLLAKGYVEPGILTNLPYEDNAFDLVRYTLGLNRFCVEPTKNHSSVVPTKNQS